MRSFRYLVKEGFKNVWVNRLMSLASIGVLVACMLIMGVAVVLTENIDNYLGDLEKQNVVMVYYDNSLDDAKAKAVNDSIAKMDNIAKVTYIPRDDGLKSLLKDMSDDYEQFFDYLDGENPLPNGSRVSLKNLEKFDATVKKLEKVEGVTKVRHQRELAEKIVGIKNTVRIASAWIIGLLLVIATVIISNTIRITRKSRKLEISSMKAVGATDSFIRAPFMVEGVVIGLFAAIFSTALLYGVYSIAIVKFESTLQGFTAIPFRDMALGLAGIFTLIGVVIGLLGSRFIIAKYLRKEGSEFRAL